jgi:EAL domain-containing protein (putative c-di-GMP-specific phosphodiesterase class I)
MPRILVCDDGPAASHLRDLLLTGQPGLRVQCETTIDGAHSKLAAGGFDIYFLGFSKHRGWPELLKVAVKAGSHTRLVCVLEDLVTEQESSALGMGVADVLTRADLSGSSLRRALRHAIARSVRASLPDAAFADAVSSGGDVTRLRDALATAKGDFALLSIHFDELAPGAPPLPVPAATLAAAIESVVKKTLRGAGDVHRLGSRLIVVVRGSEQASRLSSVADSILERLDEPVTIGEHALDVTAAIGIAISPDDGKEAADVLKAARSAMQSARAAGGRVFRFHSHPPSAAATRGLALRRALGPALERGEFVVFYQPQIDLAQNRLVGVEALLRWRSPELGAVSPVEFIPLLEESGGITAVGEWVLREACARARDWLDRGHPICFSVNVSARQFHTSDLEAIVRRVLREHELPPGMLGLELTEGMLLESSDSVRAALTALRELGVKIAVDDFGTGYASLAYLKRFPMNAIKIDREFVRGLPLDAENAAITSSIVGLAHSLAFEVVAEGVETEAEEEFLRTLQCDVVQGFLHARPMSPTDLVSWHQTTFGADERLPLAGQQALP